MPEQALWIGPIVLHVQVYVHNIECCVARGGGVCELAKYSLNVNFVVSGSQ
jgi:hypothetical protein